MKEGSIEPYITFGIRAWHYIWGLLRKERTLLDRGREESEGPFQAQGNDTKAQKYLWV